MIAECLDIFCVKFQQLYFDLFFHPKIYKKEKFIIIVQTMIGALAARNNLRVKNARQQRFQIPKISNFKVPKNVCTFGEVSLIKCG